MEDMNWARLNDAVKKAHGVLMDKQDSDGHWVFELEADCTIPAEYVLLEHYMDRIDEELEVKIGRYLRRIQGEHGGWPLYHDGKFDMSASVKSYFALKAIGDSPNEPHMVKARKAILEHGGAERSNVFTRFQLALYGEVPWEATPVMPIEMFLLPRKAVFSVWNMSYWSRTVVAPLLVLAALKPKAVNPKNITVQELFTRPPALIRDWIRGPFHSKWGHVFKAVDVAIRPFEKRSPKWLRNRAIKVTVDFIMERLNGVDGLGAIYPAMANAVMMLKAIGIPEDDPRSVQAWEALRRLIVDYGEEAYCQPCFSPIWDTGLAGHAMMEAAAGQEGVQPKETSERLAKASEWLLSKQILNVKGDWALNNPGLPPGGWAFQYDNDYYPDVDDTAVVGMMLHRDGNPDYAEAIERARLWIIGMQSSNGGWGAFDIDNNVYILNHIPFADHGALLDPPTADVTARCISFLAQLGRKEDRAIIARGVEYLRSEQEADGSWFGRWGTNYIYGTWSVLCALNAAGVAPTDPSIKRAVAWLKSVQRDDGGWGEDEASYEGAPPGQYKKSLPSQTAWAVLGLMAAGHRDDPEVGRGVTYLVETQKIDGTWDEEPYNAVGFPKVFYLKYHGYSQFFPLMAMARYKNLEHTNSRQVQYGF